MAIAHIANQMANTTMHKEVGIAANRRGEMGVGRIAETEMAQILRLIDGLHQRTDQHRLQQMPVRSRRKLSQDLLIVSGGRFLATRKKQTQSTEELPQLLELVRVRAFVDAIECRQIRAFQQACRSYVCA